MIVVFRESATIATLNEVLAASGATLGGTLPDAGLVELVLPSTATFADLDAARVQLEARSEIEAVVEDQLLSPTTAPREPINPTPEVYWSWTGGPSPAYPGNWGHYAIGAPHAWNLNYAISRKLGRKLVRVAIIDQAVQSHPDLVVVNPTGSDTSAQTHGTMVAGVIAGRWDNQRDVDGVSPFVEVFSRPYSVTGDGPFADQASFSGILEDLKAVASASPR
ncbi:MAG: hypothetical protein KC657_32795, partial [Myxococcales bacterium]|nr:hypothetical protein [Myxococcales bacterium]